jgi:hypothetical protein
MAFDADAGRIAHKGDALTLVEVTDVMRGVAWGVDDFEFSPAESKRFSSFEDAEIRFGHRKIFAKESLKIVGPEARGAG